MMFYVMKMYSTALLGTWKAHWDGIGYSTLCMLYVCTDTILIKAYAKLIFFVIILIECKIINTNNKN